jgi:hypothetical protein
VTTLRLEQALVKRAGSTDADDGPLSVRSNRSGPKGEVMERMCLDVPVKPGRRDELVGFMREVDGPRHAELDATERRIGITREVFFLADGGDHDRLVMYLEGESIGDSLGSFIASREPFDEWFKERFAACTGVDLNDPPPLEPAELLAAYTADEANP